jgi:hypothetical protein
MISFLFYQRRGAHRNEKMRFFSDYRFFLSNGRNWLGERQGLSSSCFNLDEKKKIY